ncbi:MAG TPA: VOC family protein [Pseudonocardia sp.]|nr:VOC family protein [Pseudonocardia sp.]
MALSTGIHHVAVVTRDLDLFLSFYGGVFDAPLMFDILEGGLRHAAVDLGAGSALHAFQIDGNQHATGLPVMFDRGHLDHLAIGVADPERLERARRRLVDAGASDGTVHDFGSVLSVPFRDPDGFEGEVALWRDAPTRTLAERTVVPAAQELLEPNG